MIALACVLVFVASAGLDYAHVRYARARDTGAAHPAAAWGVVQWSAGLVGFLVALKLSLWALPFEAAGLYVGTYVAIRRAQDHARVKGDRARVL